MRHEYKQELLSLRLKCSNGMTYSISESGSIIGRKGDISFPDDGFMSRNHAKVSIGSGSMSIEDLGSQNGTFVNGNKLDNKQGINVGDRVKCGSTKSQLPTDGALSS